MLKISTVKLLLFSQEIRLLGSNKIKQIFVVITYPNNNSSLCKLLIVFANPRMCFIQIVLYVMSEKLPLTS